MACGVVGEELMAHSRPMDFTGRSMTGYVFINPAGCSTGRTLQEWVAQAAGHVSILTHGPS